MITSTMYQIDLGLLSLLNGSTSLFIDSLALTLTDGYLWIPLYLLLFWMVIKNNETMAQIALIVGMALLCLLLSEGVTDFVVKPLVARLRPTADPMLKYAINVVNGYRAEGYSFFSAHAANTTAIAVYFCLLVRSRVFSAFMLLWVVANCWTRVYLGVHYPSDILVGVLWGSFSGTLCYLLFRKAYRRISPKQHFISSQYTKTGYSLPDIDVVICTLVLLFIFAIISSLI